MSLMVSRRHLEDERPSVINDELARELSVAGAKGFTGALEVLDRVTRNRARVYLYEGGLYAIDLEGYRQGNMNQGISPKLMVAPGFRMPRREE